MFAAELDVVGRVADLTGAAVFGSTHASAKITESNCRSSAVALRAMRRAARSQR